MLISVEERLLLGISNAFENLNNRFVQCAIKQSWWMEVVILVHTAKENFVPDVVAV